jgi:hypothetical protein
LFSSAAFAATAEELAESMAVDPADIVSATVAGHATMYDVLTSSGVIVPEDGSDFAYLYTGELGIGPQTGTDMSPLGTDAGDEVTLELELTAPATANSFSLDFYFLSAEYPEYVGTSYNDRFEANISGTAWSGNAAIDSLGNPITINSVLFTVTNTADLLGTDFEHVGGGTGWLTVVVPVDPGDTVTVTFSIADEADGSYDSTVILDDFEWSTTDIDTPVIIEEIDLDYLSPKRGSIDGGVATNVMGEKFNESCTAWFDGVEVPTTYVDDATLIATPGAHAVGLVDVTVKCMGVESTLVGGYTYYDVDAGNIPPLISSIDPYQVDVNGGESFQILGEDFADGASVWVGGVEVEAVFVDATHLEATTPDHAPGVVDVEVVNPDGRRDLRSGGLLYVDDPTWPPVDTGDTGDTAADAGDGAGQPSHGCATAPPPPRGWTALFLGLIVALVMFPRQGRLR